MFRAAPVLFASLLILTACGSGQEEASAPAPRDAAIDDALADPIMTDPFLSSQNDAHAAIAAGDPVGAALPPIDRSAEAIAAAKAAAGIATPAPAAVNGDLALFRDAVTAVQMAAAAKVTRADCLESAEYTARWAAALPQPFQPYPRGAVAEAAGSDADGCAMRVVHYRTPAPIEDVLAFHNARLRAAGYSAEHVGQGGDHVLKGRKGGSAYAIYVRRAEDGLTSADIVVAGS